jgi:hypothetical protein
VKRLMWLVVTAGAVAAGFVVVLAGGVASASSSLPTLTIAMDGKSVTVGGSEVSGAVNIVTTVTKESMGGPALVRLDPGVAAPRVFAAVRAAHGDLNALDGLATLVFDQDAAKGTTTSGQTLLAPGNYVALDASHNGNAPHTQFSVSQSSSPAALPAANATITAIEFAFKGPSVLHNGSVVRGVNGGYLVHMIDAFGVRSKADGLKVIALLRAGKDNQAMKITTNAFFSLAEPISPGAFQEQVLNTKPGWYVQACFMTTQDGREHTQLGMERLIKVVK